LRIPLKFGGCFKDDVVLVELSVQGTDLALAERIVQSGVNLIRRDIHARRCGPIDDDILG
jgi:hypothetical protein